MSLIITPYPTSNGMQRALKFASNKKDASFTITAKYIQVGQGLQKIELDDRGCAITESLADPVAYVEIAKAKKVNPYQWQLSVDIAGLLETEWLFSEFALCDENKEVIAIYGSAKQYLMPITPVIDSALIAVNLVLATFPADSVVIEHHNLPLELFFDKEFKIITEAYNSTLKTVLYHNNKILENTELSYKNLQICDILNAKHTINEYKVTKDFISKLRNKNQISLIVDSINNVLTILYFLNQTKNPPIDHKFMEALNVNDNKLVIDIIRSLDGMQNQHDIQDNLFSYIAYLQKKITCIEQDFIQFKVKLHSLIDKVSSLNVQTTTEPVVNKNDLH